MKISKKRLKEIIREEIIKEQDYSKVTIPSTIKRFMKRFVDSVRDGKLNKIKKISILLTVIKALGVSPQELITYMAKIKKGLKKDTEEQSPHSNYGDNVGIDQW